MALAFDGDIERGNLNESSSSIAGTTVNIVPRKIAGSQGTKWWFFFFELTGANGVQPTFNAIWADHFQHPDLTDALSDGWLPCYSYTPDDLDSWVFASSVTDNNTYGTWQFASAFNQDTVYISYAPVVRPSMLVTWMGNLSNISGTPAVTSYGGSDYEIAELASCADENSRTIPALKQHAFKFGSGSKKCVFLAGMHAGEDHGQIFFIAFIEFLLSSDSIAQSFRSEYTAYCYPNVNPQGRWGGHYRDSFETGEFDTDPNRDWDDSTGFVLDCTSNIKSAITTDTSNSFDFIFDFHGLGKLYSGPAGKPTIYGTETDGEELIRTYLTGYTSSSWLSFTSYYSVAATTACAYYESALSLDIAVAWEMEDVGGSDMLTNAELYGESLAQALLYALPSADKMDAIDFGDNNTTRYYTVPSDSAFSLPDDDWCIGFRFVMDDNSGSYYQYIIGFNTVSANNSIWIFTQEDSAGEPNTLKIYFKDGSGNLLSVASSTLTELSDGTAYLCVIQRQSDYLHIYICGEGEVVQDVGSGSVGSFGAVTCGDSLYIGCREDTNTDRFYEEHLGRIFKGNFSLTNEQIQKIAAGRALPSDFGTLDFFLDFDDPAQSTLTDSVGSLVATRHGSSYPTPSEGFSYYVAAGSTNPIPNIMQTINQFNGGL